MDRATLQWEWASYVVETTPSAPYNGKVKDLLEVEANMRQRYHMFLHFFGVYKLIPSLDDNL